MQFLITHHFRIHNAAQFYESFNESQPTRYYYFIGRTHSVANAVPTHGTVKLTSTSNTIVGNGTLFDTELSVNDIVRVTGTTQDLRVHAVTSAQTFISTVRPLTTTTVGANLYIRKLYADINPPAPTDSYQATYFDIWRNMISAKRITSADVTHTVPRYDWVSGTVYVEYDDTDSDLQHKQFYVYTDEGNVYKCIDNNYGSVSTVKPTGTLTSDITGPYNDGYRWKYMYTVSSGSVLKFVTENYIPVKTLKSVDSSSQWNVQQQAANGAIHQVKIISGGYGYLNTNGTISSVSTRSSFNLEPSASQIDGDYVGSSIFIVSGSGSGQLRKIVKYYGGNNFCIVNSAFSTSLSSTISPSKYVISPTVTIRGDSNKLATAYVSNTYNGIVRHITIVHQGADYSTANVTISANSSQGYGATARAIISPLGGHGSDAIDELFGSSIMMNIRVSGSESNTFPTNNDFRTIGVMRDPLLANGTQATTLALDQTTRVSVTEVSGDFVADEVITGLTSGAKGRLVYFANTDSARTQGVLKLIRITTNGTGESFYTGEIVRGEISTRTANVQLTTSGAFKKYSGLVIYTENRAPVTRSMEQTEDVKIIINF
jgi:hypothetical protein